MYVLEFLSLFFPSGKRRGGGVILRLEIDIKYHFSMSSAKGSPFVGIKHCLVTSSVKGILLYQ